MQEMQEEKCYFLIFFRKGQILFCVLYRTPGCPSLHKWNRLSTSGTVSKRMSNEIRQYVDTKRKGRISEVHRTKLSLDACVAVVKNLTYVPLHSK